SPPALALHRLIVAESGRFPELAAMVHHQGASHEAVRLIAGLLEREVRDGRSTLAKPEFAAQQFLQMVIALPQRRALGPGPPMTGAEREGWTREVVNL